jgi:hypothetical protein
VGAGGRARRGRPRDQPLRPTGRGGGQGGDQPRAGRRASRDRAGRPRRPAGRGPAGRLRRHPGLRRRR